MSGEKFMPVFSVIIPVYNVEGYLQTCVDSFVTQSYLNYELILVDDGSTDGTPKICDDYADKYPHIIKVIHQKNCGPSDARNAGLKAAKGKWVIFIDSDDYVRRDFFDVIRTKLNDSLSWLVFGYYIIDDNTGRTLGASSFGDSIISTCDEQSRMNFIVNELLSHRIGWEVWGKVFRRDIIEKYDVHFPSGIMIAEDQIFCVCYCMHIFESAVVDDHLYYHLERPNSIMKEYGVHENISVISNTSEFGFIHCKSSDDCKLIVNEYPIISYQLLNNEFQQLEKNHGITRKGVRKIIRCTVKNKRYLFGQFISLIIIRAKMIKYFSLKKTDLIISDVIYYIDGLYFTSAIRNRIISMLNKDLRVKK